MTKMILKRQMSKLQKTETPTTPFIPFPQTFDMTHTQSPKAEKCVNSVKKKKRTRSWEPDSSLPGSHHSRQSSPSSQPSQANSQPASPPTNNPALSTNPPTNSTHRSPSATPNLPSSTHTPPYSTPPFHNSTPTPAQETQPYPVHPQALPNSILYNSPAQSPSLRVSTPNPPQLNLSPPEIPKQCQDQPP